MFNNFDLDPFVSVLVGGASSPSYRTYVWDAENRLIEVHPAHPVGSTYSPVNNDERWRYVYDYLGRRVEKHHDKYVSGSWVTQSRTRFVYDGWNLIQELNVPTSGDPNVLRQYTWGLDLSGLSGNSSVSGLHGAGGIGGLLAVLDTNNTTTTSDDHSYAYVYDANGNVGQLVDWASGAGGSTGMAWASGRLAAKYEYDPYGNIVGPDADGDGNIAEEAGPYAATNPFRFSTKFLDPETALNYYGYRYYSPRLGRWISRDPLEEDGGVHLYVALSNAAVNANDSHGLQATQPADQAGPYGTCSDCVNVCKDASLYGRSKCQNGAPCYCVCANNIRTRGVERDRPGLETANKWIVACVQANEQLHDRIKRERSCCAPGACCKNEPSTECASDVASLECVLAAIQACDVLTDAPERQRCKNRLRPYVRDYLTCKPYVGEKPCPADDVSRCNTLRGEVRRALGGPRP
ncbi:MAG: RHS repeat-associated core domain-containing protein [Phycisphaerales bacterium]|nr:RHS repeat-associated core domain-containing protein [Phycisphaerales bacterium]